MRQLGLGPLHRPWVSLLNFFHRLAHRSLGGARCIRADHHKTLAPAQPALARARDQSGVLVCLLKANRRRSLASTRILVNRVVCECCCVIRKQSHCMALKEDGRVCAPVPVTSSARLANYRLCIFVRSRLSSA
eukprot:IDg22582t1